MRLLSRYPWAVLATSGLLSLLSILCSLTLHTLPDFTDPQEVSAVQTSTVQCSTVSSIWYSTNSTDVTHRWRSDYRWHPSPILPSHLIKLKFPHPSRLPHNYSGACGVFLVVTASPLNAGKTFVLKVANELHQFPWWMLLTLFCRLVTVSGRGGCWCTPDCYGEDAAELQVTVSRRAGNEPSRSWSFTNTEKAPSRASSWLKALSTRGRP